MPYFASYSLPMWYPCFLDIAEAMKLRNTNDLPIFIIADTFGRVVFVSQGYTIGLGEQMMQVVRKL